MSAPLTSSVTLDNSRRYPTVYPRNPRNDDNNNGDDEKDRLHSSGDAEMKCEAREREDEEEEGEIVDAPGPDDSTAPKEDAGAQWNVAFAPAEVETAFAVTALAARSSVSNNTIATSTSERDILPPRKEQESNEAPSAASFTERLVRLIASHQRQYNTEPAVTSVSTESPQRYRWQSIEASNMRVAQRATAAERTPQYVDHGAADSNLPIKWMGRASVEQENESKRLRLMRRIQRERKGMTAKVARLRKTYRIFHREWRAHCDRLNRVGEGPDFARRVVTFGGSGPATPLHPSYSFQTDRLADEGTDGAGTVSLGIAARTRPADGGVASMLIENDSQVSQQQRSLGSAHVSGSAMTAANAAGNASNSASAVTSAAISSNSVQNGVTSFDDSPSAGGLLASATAAAMTRANRRNTQSGGGLVGFGDAVRSEAEFLEILATLESADMQDPSMRAARTTAVEPDMVLSTVKCEADTDNGTRCKQEHRDMDTLQTEVASKAHIFAGRKTGDDVESYALRRHVSDFVGRETMKRSFDDDNGFVADPLTFFLSDFDPDFWSDEEKTIFARRYALFPKQFGKIAASLPNKTAKQCVSYYYLTKKLYGHDYKSLLASRNRDRRRKTKLVKPKKGRGSALMADLKAAEDAQEDTTEKPRSRIAGGEEEVPETLIERPRNRQSTSSYWSVAERNDFLRSLAVVGKDWDAIAVTLASKSAAQARNFFSRNGQDPDFVEAAELARINFGRPLDERREAAERFVQRPTGVEDLRRAGSSGTPSSLLVDRGEMALDAATETSAKARQRSEHSATGVIVPHSMPNSSGEIMRGLDISSLLNADPDSASSSNNSTRRTSKQVYWFDRFMTFDHQRSSDEAGAQHQRASSPPPPSASPPHQRRT